MLEMHWRPAAALRLYRFFINKIKAKFQIGSRIAL